MPQFEIRDGVSIGGIDRVHRQNPFLPCAAPA
jgi:hypothetical protein